MEINKSFHNNIAQLCLDHFKALPKSGKPNSTEWTILSCIVLERDTSLSVVALGTGSKCIGQSKMSASGEILNDSHAEVICRRSFLRFIYNQMQDDNSFLTFDDHLKKFVLKSGIKFHFFTTHVPCGDCAIFPKECLEDFGEVLNKNDEESEQEVPSKKAKLDQDIFRTGAKCLGTDIKQDLKLPGKDYHILGAVRTKPGRGDPTSSVSCSDKITKWCYLGIQGALLSLLLDKPIYLSSFTIGGGTPFSSESINRAFYGRIGKLNLIVPFVSNQMIIGQSNVDFNFAKVNEKQPCPTSISWCKVKEKRLEVAVEGKKQGVTKKKINSEFGRLKISKLELFKSFMTIVRLKKIDVLNDLGNKSCYGNVKKMAKAYQINWNSLKEILGTWVSKDPNLLHFVIDK